MENKDIRWKQRFQNFEKAYLSLHEAMMQKGLNELERNGLIQRFEFTIDLAWKVVKDYLEEKGFAFKLSPKDTLRQAQQAGYIDYAQQLIDGLDIRNELSRDYSGEKFVKSEMELRNDIFPALKKLYQFFKMNSNQPNSFGLTERDMQTLTEIFKRYPDVKSVYLFGSRAKGTFKQGSDIDLAIMNDGVSDKTIRDIKADFEDSSLPYNVDLAYLATMEHRELREHVSRVGIATYTSVIRMIYNKLS